VWVGSTNSSFFQGQTTSAIKRMMHAAALDGRGVCSPGSRVAAGGNARWYCGYYQSPFTAENGSSYLAPLRMLHLEWVTWRLLKTVGPPLLQG
jgi:hypothetical protein